MKKLPLISIVIPTLNSEKDIGRCLSSIFKQSYPKNKLEIFVVDNYSSDKTVAIAKKFGVKIIYNKTIGNLYSKMIALKKASGDYFIYFDSDIDVVGDNWFEKMLYPLERDLSCVASFCRFVGNKQDPALSRYLSYDLLQRDPIYEFFSPSVTDTIIKPGTSYDICEYSVDKIPPSGLCLYRRKMLLGILDLEKDKKFMELDNLVRLVRDGYRRFAFVHEVGMHHPFVNDLGNLMEKRLRNISKNYLSQSDPRLYKWFDLKTFRGITKVLVWVIYVSTLAGPLIRGVLKSIKNKDFACFYEPIVSFIETWVIILGFLYFGLKNVFKRSKIPT